MGVDLIAAIEHRLSTAKLLNLPELIDSLSAELKAIKFAKGDLYDRQSKPAVWEGDEPMNEEVLERIWNDWQSGTQLSDHRIFDNSVDCFLGTIDVWKNTLLICHFPEHKYGNLYDPEKARIILESNRCVARALGADKILYFPDSGFPTSLLLDEAQRGLTIAGLITWAEKQYGASPKLIGDGMQYMYFVDDFQELDGQLREWDFSEEKYWKFNTKTGGYERVNRAKE